MLPIAFLFSLIAATPVSQTTFAGSPTFAPAARPTTEAYFNPPIFQGPSLSTIKTEWRKDYESLANKQQILNNARASLKAYIPETATEVYSEQGNGTIIYVCGDDQTYGQFPTSQRMDIGFGSNYATLAIDYFIGGSITHKDGSAVELGPRWQEIPSPVNSNKNGNWAVFELKPQDEAQLGVLTGATYGYIDKVKGGQFPKTCDVIGQRISFDIVATYHLFK